MSEQSSVHDADLEVHKKSTLCYMLGYLYVKQTTVTNIGH